MDFKNCTVIDERIHSVKILSKGNRKAAYYKQCTIMQMYRKRLPYLKSSFHVLALLGKAGYKVIA